MGWILGQILDEPRLSAWVEGNLSTVTAPFSMLCFFENDWVQNRDLDDTFVNSLICFFPEYDMFCLFVRGCRDALNLDRTMKTEH